MVIKAQQSVEVIQQDPFLPVQTGHLLINPVPALQYQPFFFITSLPVRSHVVNAIKCVDGKKEKKKRSSQVKLKISWEHPNHIFNWQIKQAVPHNDDL